MNHGDEMIFICKKGRRGHPPGLNHTTDPGLTVKFRNITSESRPLSVFRYKEQTNETRYTTGTMLENINGFEISVY